MTSCPTRCSYGFMHASAVSSMMKVLTSTHLCTLLYVESAITLYINQKHSAHSIESTIVALEYFEHSKYLGLHVHTYIQ